MPEQKIDDVTIRCEKLPAREAQRLLLRLGKVLGPALDGIAVLRGGVDEESTERVMAAIINDVLARADVDEADSLITQLVESAQIKTAGGSGYEAIVFDHHFQNNLLGAWKVAGFVLKVNFADFFGAVGRSAQAAATAATRPGATSSA